MVRTSVPWRYEVQQVDVLASGELSSAEVYLALQGSNDDVAGSWPTTGVSLLDPTTSAEDLAAALSSLPSAGEVSVVRVPSAAIEDSSVASRHLVTFMSHGGDVPLLRVEDSTVTDTRSEDNGFTDCPLANLSCA